MVKDGLKVSLLAGLFFVYPAVADDSDLKPVADKSLAKQEQPMDQPAPDANYQEPTDGDDKRAEIAAEFPPEPEKSVAQQVPQATDQQPKGDNQFADNGGVTPEQDKTGALQAQPTYPQAPHPEDQQHKGDQSANAITPAGKVLAQQEPANHRDYQPIPKGDEELRGHEISESDENVYESDQQQYEQAQANADPSIDKKNNELQDRVIQEQSKLQNDSAGNNSTAVENDKQNLALDKQQLQQQELLAANQSENLEEFNMPERPEIPVAENAQPAVPQTPSDPAAPAQNTELAMNQQPARVPW